MSARLLGLTVITLLAGCDPGPLKPAEPAWSKQACAHCLMLLSDKRTAAQLTLSTGEREYFDDVGCMVSFLAEGQAETKALWVRAPNGESWIRAESALFASGATTPMDFGFVPAESGISFEQLKQQVRARAARAPEDRDAAR